MNNFNAAADQIITEVPAMRGFVDSLRAVLNSQETDLKRKDETIKELSEQVATNQTGILQHNAKITDMGDEVKLIGNKVDECKSRILALEKYCSKDCLIFYNAPVDHQKEQYHIMTAMINFISHIFNIHLIPADIVHCHPLGRSRDGRTPPPIIVKFAQFWKKDIIWKNRNNLRGEKSQGAFIYMNERLPEAMRETFNEARRRKLDPFTSNCDIIIEQQVGDRRVRHKVDSIRELDAMNFQPLPVRTNKEYHVRKPLPSSEEMPTLTRAPVQPKPSFKRPLSHSPATDNDALSGVADKIRMATTSDEALAVLRNYMGRSPVALRFCNESISMTEDSSANLPIL